MLIFNKSALGGMFLYLFDYIFYGSFFSVLLKLMAMKDLMLSAPLVYFGGNRAVEDRPPYSCSLSKKQGFRHLIFPPPPPLYPLLTLSHHNNLLKLFPFPFSLIQILCLLFPPLHRLCIRCFLGFL